MKKLISLTTLLCLYTAGSGQNIRPLTIGDTVPDITLNHILNYKTSSAKISGFKGKLLILDFWSTFCGSCIAGFPHNNAIQKTYGDRIQILNVGYESTEKIRNFLVGLEQRRGSGYRITTVTSDTLLKKYFPYMVLPHLVWIGSDRVVKAITGGEHLTENNIDKALANQAVDVQIKQDISMNTPLFLGTEAVTRAPFTFQRYSLFVTGPFYDGAGAEQKYFQNDTAVYGLNYTNQKLHSIIRMLGHRLWKEKDWGAFSAKRINVETTDPAIISMLQDTICQYAFFLPERQSRSFYSKALNTLGKYTGINARFEQRTIPCLLLVRISEQDKIRATDSTKENTLFSNDSCRINNYPVQLLAKRLDALPLGLPVLDSTGYKENISLTFYPPYTLPALRLQLIRYGLDLVPAQENLCTLVVKSDNNGEDF